MNNQKTTTLYNVMFPIWFFFVMPTWLWLILLPANFAIDTLVERLTLKKQGFEKEDRHKIWQKTIVKVWLLGFLCDFLGGLVCLGLMILADHVPVLNLVYKLPYVWTQVVTGIPGVIVAGVLIYFMNRWLSFKNTDLSAQVVHRLSLALALFTAPYTMLIPLYW